MNLSSAARIVADLRVWLETAPAGARLPSSRELSERYKASPVTVQKAMRMLVALGLVESRPGAGSFALGRRAAARPLDFSWQTGALRSAAHPLPALSAPLRETAVDKISLHAGYPAKELLPERAVRAALVRAARGDAAIVKSPAGGLPELQAWFASELASVTPSGVTPVAARDVLVVPGTQSALSSIFRVLAGAGQPVIMESPSYWGAILAAAQAGVTIVPIPSGPEGPEPADLEAAFAESGAKVFYAQPNYANPTGAQWSPSLREKMLSVVRAQGAFLIEDDWAKDFGIDNVPTPMAAYDDTGHIIYIRSLAKSVSPAVRIGAVIARGPVRERLQADRNAESMYVSGMLQAAALEVVLQPAWRSHLRSLRGQLRERRDLLASGVTRFMPQATLDHLPRGGLNLWVQLPDEIDLPRLVQECERRGVLIAAGSEWFPAEQPGNFVRLNYAGPDPARFTEGTAVIGAAMRQQLDASG